MFYLFRVNRALAKMAALPHLFDKKWVASGGRVGENDGLTPQETAVVIVGYMMGNDHPIKAAPVIIDWIGDGKINPLKLEMKTAFKKMGLGGFAEKESSN